MNYLHNVHVHNISIVKDLFYTTANNKKYYLCHGDRFDFINTYLVFLGRVANFLYSVLYLLEKARKREIVEELYTPLSEKVKMWFKEYFFPKNLLHKKAFALADELDCDGVILGHYHMPDYVKRNNKEYFNSGDWISSCTAVVENEEGNLELIYYK